MVTKKRAGIGVTIGAAALAILSQYGIEDQRLPDEVIVAVYHEAVLGPKDNGADAWYGIPFPEARAHAAARAAEYLRTGIIPMETGVAAVTFYAIPKTALKPFPGDLEPPYPEGVSWQCLWSREKTIAEGEVLDPSQDYPGRFVVKEE